ncbi:MAG: VanZ family protein, partial [Acidobacteriota bacterium]
MGASCIGGCQRWGLPANRADWLDVLLNLCLFLPLGLLPGIQCRDGRDRRISLLLTTFFSLVLELVQAYIRGRDSSLRDLALNSMSA